MILSGDEYRPHCKMMKTKAKPMQLTCPKLHKWLAEPDSNPESLNPKGVLNHFKIANSFENNLDVTCVKEKLGTICFSQSWKYKL